jgi:hypothetical protein
MARYRLGVPVDGLFCSAGGPPLEVLEYLGILSVLFSVIFYYSEAADRKKQKYYQAWQVIDTAQAKGGSGGRIEALQELTADGVPLVGVDVSEAFLEGVQLPGAKLARTDLEAADLRNSMLEGSDLEYAALRSANFRSGSLRLSNLLQTDLEDADLVGANLQGANLTNANFKNADLRNADLKGIQWQATKAIDSANVHGIRNAPRGFVNWALQHGAVAVRCDDE